MVFLCIACIVLSSIALHGIALHRIAWHCMVLQRLHGVVQIIWRAGELPRSASSHFVLCVLCVPSLKQLGYDLFTLTFFKQLSRSFNLVVQVL